MKTIKFIDFRAGIGADRFGLTNTGIKRVGFN